MGDFGDNLAASLFNINSPMLIKFLLCGEGVVLVEWNTYHIIPLCIMSASDGIGQFLVFPLALMPNMNSLRFTSILSICLVGFVVICMLQDSIRYMFDSGGSQDMFKKSLYFARARYRLPAMWHFRSGRPWASLPVQALHEHLPVSTHRHFLLPGFVGVTSPLLSLVKAIHDTPRSYYSLPHLQWNA